MIGTWKSEDWILMIAWVRWQKRKKTPKSSVYRNTNDECVSQLFATAYSICQYGQVANGAGRHLAASNSIDNAITSQKYAFAAQVILFEAIALPKLSICLSYLRIFYSDRIGRRLIQVLMFLVVGAFLPFGIEQFFQCKPLHVYWTEFRPGDKCLRDLSALYVSGGLNAAVDLALMTILIPRIMGLKLNSRQKGALIGIVCLGSVAVVAAVVRMVKVGTTLGRPDVLVDPPWDTYDISIWTSTEIYVSLICAAAPGIKPLISKILPHVLGTTLRSRSRSRVTGGNTTNPIELSSKLKRSTIGTGASTTVLTTSHGQYAEFGRGVDEESLRSKSQGSDKSRHFKNMDNRIIKKSEITIHTSDRQE